MVVQEDDDRRRYEAELVNLNSEKESQLTRLGQELERLKQQKQELEVTSQSAYMQTQGRN